MSQLALRVRGSQLPPAGQSCPIFEGQTSEPWLCTRNLTTGVHMTAGSHAEEEGHG